MIPYFRMDSLFLLSDVVIYCDELELQSKEIPHESTTPEGDKRDWTETRTITKCRVRQAFNGTLAAGAELTVEYGSLFRRYTLQNKPYTELNSSGKVIAVHQAEILPAGRVLLFLRKKGDGYEVLSAKLVQAGKVYKFIQMSNPGPLMLDLQRAENLKLPQVGEYAEPELLQDAAAALEQSHSLKAPVRER